MRPFEGGLRITIEITDRDLVRVPLDKIDRVQLREPKNGLADVLLDLELIARRLEQGPQEPEPLRIMPRTGSEPTE